MTRAKGDSRDNPYCKTAIGCDDEVMALAPPEASKPVWQIPRISPANRWVGGVAAAIAREIGVQPAVIRVSFVVLAVASGAGIVAYLGFWIWLVARRPDPSSTYVPVPKGQTSEHRHLGVGLVVVGLIIMIRALTGVIFVDSIVLPLGIVAVGVLVAWTTRDPEATHSTIARIILGSLIGIGGVIIFVVLSASTITALMVFLATAATLTAVGLLAGPILFKLTRDLDQERLDRARSDERARMAAHLHDSVLQTLALIQKHADDSTRIAQLSRRQERELRQWLYRSSGSENLPPHSTRLTPALEQMADRIDETHGVPVKVIVVGDTRNLDPAAVTQLVSAAGEAAVNAAKHANTMQIDVYAEVHPDRLEAFVRDTGQGFDPDEVPADRRGIADSIIGRLNRSGGSASIHSVVGEGTEVELSIPLESAAADTTPQESPPEKGES